MAALKKYDYALWLLIVYGLIGCTSPPPLPTATVPIITQKPIVSKPAVSAPQTATVEQPHQLPPETRVAPASYPPLAIPVLPATSLPDSLTSLSRTSAVPGGIAWVPLPYQAAQPPAIIYRQQRVLVLRDPQQWVALVGVPLDARVGLHRVTDQKTGQHYTFNVVDKRYKTQHIKLKNKRQVNPNAQDLKRIQRETQLIKAALASPWRATTTSPLPLTQPVSGRLSSAFGLRRYFNGQARKPHSGLDIAAPRGRPVIAAAAGIVVNTGHYFFNGKSVFIDHGQGVVTFYGHLNSIMVTSGQTVARGEPIGTVGKTGRATGPHLHWGVSLNNALIDPNLVMVQ
jgi:hypothetical protein